MQPATPPEGVINFHKPVGVTSAKALYRVRRIVGQRKSGHSGTLDPGASGVLVLCLGRGTKLVERIMDHPKVYRATARLDVTSESFDSDRPLLPVEVVRVPTRDEVLRAAAGFEGDIEQVPPAVSALKIGGVPSYRRVLRGQTVEPAARRVRIDWLFVHAYDWPTVEFSMCCGRGTYVRSVIRDLGRTLGVGGCLTGLVRLRVGPFALAEAWTVEAMEAAPGPEAYVIPLEESVRRLDPDAIAIPSRPR